jgi:hypothetical protein
MARTIRRQPFNVSTASKDNPTSYFFNQVQFNGLCDNKNDVSIDQQTLSDAKNVYVDEGGVLTSRPPLRIFDGKRQIIDCWNFGPYGLRLYRYLCKDDVEITNPQDYDIRTLSFVFQLESSTHETVREEIDGDLVYDKMQWTIPLTTIGWEYSPEIMCAQIEDKIFVWFGGIDLVVFNTRGKIFDGTRKYYFEDAIKYLYYPVHKLVTNGIETELESKNFLTDTYRRRYQYSLLSSVNFEKLAGRRMSVGLNSSMTQNQSSHLYDVTMSPRQDKMLIYPYSQIGDNYYIDVAQTSRATTILRYSIVMHTMEVSFDGKSFRQLPSLEEVIGLPLLTRDGMWAVAFTRTGLAKCQLVAQESSESQIDWAFAWSIDAYLRLSNVSVIELDTAYVPVGYFETIDQFAYIISANTAPSILTPYLYTEWLSGSNSVIYNLQKLVVRSGTYELPCLKNDDLKIHFRYIAPTGISATNSGVIVSIMTQGLMAAAPTLGVTYQDSGPGILMYVFDQDDVTSSSKRFEKYFELCALNGNSSLSIDDKTYTLSEYDVPCRQMDVQAFVPVTETDGDSPRTYFKLIAAYSLIGKNDDEYRIFDFCTKIQFNTSTAETVFDEYNILPDGNSKWFKIMPNTDTILTDRYLFIDNDIILLPQNGEVSPITEDTERIITNGDNLVLALEDGSGEMHTYSGNIHKLDSAGLYLVSGIIESGDLVSYTQDAVTEYDYLGPLYDLDGNGPVSNRYIIEKFTVSSGGFVGIVGGEIKAGDLVRLRSYDRQIILHPSHPANPTNGDYVILQRRDYPSAPSGWTRGDDWPDSFPVGSPLVPDTDGTIRHWRAGDPLPTGAICMYGIVNFSKRIQAVSINDTGVWYNIDGTLWTSQLSDDVIFELDEYVGNDILDNTNFVDINLNVPTKHAVMNEHYFSYVDDGRNLLEVMETRRDVSKHLSNKGDDLLLYMPKFNEQFFANKITALHPLSDKEMGIFTDTDVWYIGMTTLDDVTVAYTKPIKSKVPVYLRDGDSVITALDGQALIFPTPRGLAVLAPQDFIATTEKSVNYLSDAIQERYKHFYEDGVPGISFASNEGKYLPEIHLQLYKHWVLMYKRFDKEILALDTRTSSWWIWTTPYPIRSMLVEADLQILMQIDFSVPGQSGAPKIAPYMGMLFTWAEPTDERYEDDVIENALNGTITLVREETIGDRRILHHATPIIDWHITSQRLHFNQINNYKTIRGINLNLKGDDAMTAKFSTKVFRNIHHPEQEDVVEMKVNDLRTFVKRFNLMHVINFQYKIENDSSVDPHRLKLNSLCIKYEVKERIR